MPSFKDSPITLTFVLVLLLTILVYVLRGVGILTFIPGGIIWLLFFFSLITGILWGVEKTKRF